MGMDYHEPCQESYISKYKSPSSYWSRQDEQGPREYAWQLCITN